MLSTHQWHPKHKCVINYSVIKKNNIVWHELRLGFTTPTQHSFSTIKLDNLIDEEVLKDVMWFGVNLPKVQYHWKLLVPSTYLILLLHEFGSGQNNYQETTLYAIVWYHCWLVITGLNSFIVASFFIFRDYNYNQANIIHSVN